MTAVIKVDRVSRWFGPVVAVSDVSFEVKPGITGLLGPNGAGKTTLFRMITGLAETSSGTVTVFGQGVRDNPPLYGRLGVMSEHETVYGFMTGREFVSAMAKLRPAVDAFFEKVTVNAEDPKLRENRLKLLNEIRQATRAVADFSRIEG